MGDVLIHLPDMNNRIVRSMLGTKESPNNSLGPNKRPAARSIRNSWGETPTPSYTELHQPLAKLERLTYTPSQTVPNQKKLSKDTP